MPKTTDKNKYFVVKERAVPEVLLNVVAAKKLLESKRAATVQEAADAVGISRSSFYKYKDDIFPFHEEAKGKTITFIIQMDDEPGILSNVLRAIAENHGNILTIHQSIPISGIATLTLSVQILQGEGDAEAMVDDIEQMEGIHYLKILGRGSGNIKHNKIAKMARGLNSLPGFISTVFISPVLLGILIPMLTYHNTRKANAKKMAEKQA